MNKIFQENLCKIIDDYGHLVYREDKRLEGLLKDLCPQQKKEINLIMSAVKNGSVEEMLNYNNTYPLESLLAKLINKLVNEHGINEILAQKTIHLIADSLKLNNTLEIISEKVNLQINTKNEPSLKIISESEEVNLQINKKIKPSLYELQNFFYAIEKNDIKKVKEIIDDGIDINIKSYIGQPALMAATRGGNIEIVNLLITSGADINIKDNIGYTSLMMAALYGNIEIVNLLIASGADVNIKNDFGTTALMLAKNKGGNSRIFNLLISAGAYKR